MFARRALKVSSVVALSFGLLLLASAEAAGPSPKDAAKYHEQLKSAKDAKAKVEALNELGKLGQIQKALVTPSMDLIVKSLEDKDATVRSAGAKALGMIDPDPKVAVPALLKLVKEEKDESVKIAAITGLGLMGDNAKDASTELRNIMKAEKEDKKSKLGKAAKTALESINGKKK